MRVSSVTMLLASVAIASVSWAQDLEQRRIGASIVPGSAPSGYRTPAQTSKSGVPMRLSAIQPFYQFSGKVELSIDGLGVWPETSGMIQVRKNAGATVRKAFFLAASMGTCSRCTIPVGAISVNGTPVPTDGGWDMNVQGLAFGPSQNYLEDVTALLKPLLDGAASGIIDVTITEDNTRDIDGTILAVVFDNPSLTQDFTVALLFGHQEISGDEFLITLAEPVPTLPDPDYVLDMSLGISYGYQPTDQVSLIDVNGARLTSSAGGQDDGCFDPGCGDNGLLLTVGGIDDTNANPPPMNPASTPRTDDELYNLVPFVQAGDTQIRVHTVNPSNDDNIFFAAFTISGIGHIGDIGLSQDESENDVRDAHTVTATVSEDGTPVPGEEVTFTVLSGPNAGTTGTGITDANGEASFTYLNTTQSVGDDEIQACFLDSDGDEVCSNILLKTWVIRNHKPVPICVLDGVTVAANSDCLGEVSAEDLDGGSFDPDSTDTITPTAIPPGPYPLGTTQVTLEVCDNQGACDSCFTTVTVVDDTPPQITLDLNRDTLWPPNHKLVDIAVTATVADNCDANPTVVLTSIVSNEPDSGLGDGDTANDIQLGPTDFAFRLRSERSGQGTGRKYTITYTVTDASGNASAAVACVFVPHDQSGKAMASIGYTADGRGLRPDMISYLLVIPARTHGPAQKVVDVRRIDPARVYVGNELGALRPQASTIQDVDGDREADLVLRYASAPVQDLVELSGDANPVGLHFRDSDGDNFLVNNIFALGPPVAVTWTDRGQGEDTGLAKATVSSPSEVPSRSASLRTVKPNPFNPSTTVSFQLDQAARVQVSVHDIRGLLVQVLVDRELPRGLHEATWNGRDRFGRTAPSGLYFFELHSGEVREVQKAVLLK